MQRATRQGVESGAPRRRQRAQVRRRLETRLYGLGEAWHQLGALRSLEAMARSLPARDSFGVSDPNKALVLQSAREQRTELTRSLQRHGFTSIEDLERTLNEYAAVLREEALALALELLARYMRPRRAAGGRMQSCTATSPATGSSSKCTSALPSRPTGWLRPR